MMFVQEISGHVRHSEPIYVELDAWIKDIAATAEGWLGSTAGVTKDNRFLGLNRWESEQAARRHSARPEQDHWWSAFTELFVDRPSIRGTADVYVDAPGDPDRAHFVQVMRGRGSNPDRARELIGAHRDEWAAFRPEILARVGAMFGDGTFTVAAYFTDEQAAREGERKEPPPQLKAEMDELNSLADGQPDFLDLREPWLHSP